MHITIFTTVIFILGLTIVSMVLCRALRLPAILGYLIIGIVCGPHAIGWIAHPQYTEKLAELGVILLMFMVGLEFSLKKLLELRFNVFVLGGIQVVATIIISTLIGTLTSMNLTQAIIVGGIIAMSSTAIVIKQLGDQLELNTDYGTNAVGILLFQDMAVIPFFIVITALAGQLQGHIGASILWAIVKGVLVVSAMLVIGRMLIRPIFHIITRTKIREIFTLLALLITLLSAWLTSIAGLSPALGAFIGGVLLAESKFRHQIKVEIRPFRDIFMGIFFISIGTIINFSTWPQTWVWIVIMLAGLMLGKSSLIICLSRFFKYSLASSIRTGLILAQGGEFGFAILLLAMHNKQIPNDYSQVILGALTLSFALAPILIQYQGTITNFILRNNKDYDPDQAQKEIEALAENLQNHVILCGFGRVGQNLGRLLTHEKHDYIALDTDPTIIHNTQLAGLPVIYGDATHPDILTALQIDKAKALVISFDHTTTSIKVLERTRANNKKIPILVRCKDNEEYRQLQGHGATEIITETFEESLAIAYYLLHELHVPKSESEHLLREVRIKNYEVLRKVFQGKPGEKDDSTQILGEQLQPFLIPSSAHAIGKSIGELKLEKFKAKIVTVRPQQKQRTVAHNNTILQAGDIIVIFGTLTAIESAEAFIQWGQTR